MSVFRRLIPSMFHRRLVLLGLMMVLASTALAGQLVHLTVLEYHQRLAEAESVLSTTRPTPTIRGRILDRKGRVLARDEPGWDVVVDYAVINGDWAFTKARNQALREHRDRWAELSIAQRFDLVQTYLPSFQDQEEQLWRTLCRVAGIDREELERRKRMIVRRVQMIRATVEDRRYKRLVELSDEPVSPARAAVQLREERQAHTLIASVSESVAMTLRKLKDQLPGLDVVESKFRSYPLQRAVVEIDRSGFPFHLKQDITQLVPVEHLGALLIGSMRDVWAEDVTGENGRPYRRPDGSIDLGGYLPGDHVGKRGIELAAERRLRGSRGLIQTQLDTGQHFVTESIAGHDVRLTLDIALQARLRALMNPSLGLMTVQDWHANPDAELGTPLNGSAVVLDVDSGQILAMVSSPTIPPEQAVELPEQGPWPTKWDHPDVCRPISAIYPPGSTLKPVVYSIAAAAGAIQIDQVFTCKGHLLPNKPNVFRCWGWRPAEGKYLQHGPLTPPQAIARSCNVYFYSCGRRLGAKRLCEGLLRWGYGQKTGVGLAEEVGGFVPSAAGDNPPGCGLNQHNATLMGIGQGPISVTVLQVACAHAALARGGYWLAPVLMQSDQAEQIGRDLHLAPRVLDNVLQGMFDSANASFGTGNHITFHGSRTPIFQGLDDLLIRAKTGTAQAPSLIDDVNHNGRLDPGERIIRSGNHSWFVAHVQKPGHDRASVVIAVLIEYGGSGGRVAGPLINQIIHAVRDEGYL